MGSQAAAESEDALTLFERRLRIGRARCKESSRRVDDRLCKDGIRRLAAFSSEACIHGHFGRSSFLPPGVPMVSVSAAPAAQPRRYGFRTPEPVACHRRAAAGIVRRNGSSRPWSSIAI